MCCCVNVWRREVLEYVIDTCFLVDLILNFRTAVQTVEGVVDVTPRGIAATYLRGWFTIDLLSTFPFVRAEHGAADAPSGLHNSQVAFGSAGVDVVADA